MLDINFVRGNFDAVIEKLQSRGFSTEVLEHFTKLETERRANIRKVDDLKALRKSREPGDWRADEEWSKGIGGIATTASAADW
jgi:seryl-tRNA synthetase